MYDMRTLLRSILFLAWFFVPLTVVRAADVRINAYIQPKPEQIHARVSVSPQQDIYHVGDIVTVTYTLSHDLAYTADMMGTMHWETGHVQGGDGTQLPVYEYVFGSATSSTGKTPLVYTNDARIEFPLGGIPAGQEITYTASFKLINVPANVLVDAPIIFSTHHGQGTIGNITQSITMDHIVTPTPTPPKNLVIARVSTTAKTAHDITLTIQANEPTNYTISYGTSPDYLTMTVRGTEQNQLHTVTIPGLTPATQYFFAITLKNNYGAYGSEKTVQDIVVATTAQVSNDSAGEIREVHIEQLGQVLLTGTQSTAPVALGQAAQITVRVPYAGDIARAELLLTDTRGISTPFLIYETIESVLSGSFVIPDTGSYSLQIHLIDKDGTEHLLTIPRIQLFGSKPFTVLSAQGNPIAGAHITATSPSSPELTCVTTKDGFCMIAAPYGALYHLRIGIPVIPSLGKQTTDATYYDQEGLWNADGTSYGVFHVPSSDQAITISRLFSHAVASVRGISDMQRLPAICRPWYAPSVLLTLFFSVLSFTFFRIILARALHRKKRIHGVYLFEMEITTIVIDIVLAGGFTALVASSLTCGILSGIPVAAVVGLVLFVWIHIHKNVLRLAKTVI